MTKPLTVGDWRHRSWKHRLDFLFFGLMGYWLPFFLIIVGIVFIVVSLEHR